MARAAMLKVARSRIAEVTRRSCFGNANAPAFGVLAGVDSADFDREGLANPNFLELDNLASVQRQGGDEFFVNDGSAPVILTRFEGKIAVRRGSADTRLRQLIGTLQPFFRCEVHRHCFSPSKSHACF
jgi:hypothetical protein